MPEAGQRGGREALTMTFFWAALVAYLIALGALAFLGADPIWWVGAFFAVIALLAIGRGIAPPGFTEAQAQKQPDRRTVPRLIGFFVLVMVVAGVLAYLGAMRS